MVGVFVLSSKFQYLSKIHGFMFSFFNHRKKGFLIFAFIPLWFLTNPDFLSFPNMCIFSLQGMLFLPLELILCFTFRFATLFCLFVCFNFAATFQFHCQYLLSSCVFHFCFFLCILNYWPAYLHRNILPLMYLSILCLLKNRCKSKNPHPQSSYYCKRN